MKNLVKCVGSAYQHGCIKTVFFCQRHANVFLLAAGFVFLSGGIYDLSHAQVQYIGSTGYEVMEDTQHGAVTKMLQGAFGSLIMVVAGLGALGAAAMGSYKAAVIMLIIAGSAFGMRAMANVSLGYDQIRYTNATQ